MKKRMAAILTLTLVLIGLIFLVFYNSPEKESYKGVLVKSEEISRWQTV